MQRHSRLLALTGILGSLICFRGALEHPNLIVSLSPKSDPATRLLLSDLQDLTADGALQVNGNVNVLGNLSITGMLTVSGKQAGTITIPAGQTSVHVSFPAALDAVPVIVGSSDNFTPWSIRGPSTTGFTVELRHATDSDVSIDWFAMGVNV